ncbi:MAG TPA: DNA polymerase [Candidatus Paceibacterota bacterium]|nr:DNA polymerase [Candidatus Paceibacterota bacterium]
MAKKQSKTVGSKPARLVLLDSHAILHRAYHALPDFSSTKGEPTGALYGLISMLLRIVDDLKPEYVVATRDLPGGTHRHELFQDYKGTRVKTEDELIRQLERAPDVFKAFGIPVYQAPGYEADDCLGTIVHELKGQDDIETIIASGDMDTLQLVSPSVSVYTMRKGLTDTILYDEDRVRERYGFGPESVVDYKALRGDPSDNIPGVKGIGEKTATELIQKCGSLDELYAALDTKPETLAHIGIKPRIIELLKEHRAEAMISKTLATISHDAPIQFVLPPTPWRLAEHLATVDALCDELEFKSLKERVHTVSHVRDAAAGAVFEQNPEAVVARADIDAQSLAETSVALWLLHSDTSNPSLEDILTARNTDDFEQARREIFEDLAKTGRLMEIYERIEKPLIPIARRMHEDGIRVDAVKLKMLAKEYNKELGMLAGRIFAAAGHEFNINSPKQLGVVLYDELKIVPEKQKKTATGARTTREEELAKLTGAHPIIADVLAYRELQKLLSTYIEKIPALIADDGRLHAQFLQAGTTTGRMASESPNLQNIPIKTDQGRRIRTAFTADAGNVLVAIDYSQIELRIAAGLSGDEKLIHVFKEGGDVHTAVAAEVFGVAPENVDREMRRRAKVINFGILYGMGVNALRANLGVGVSRDDAAQYLADYFKNFSGLREWIDRIKFEAAQNGYTETLFGRRRYFPGFKSSLPGIVAQAERMAVNAPIQGTQADIIKLAMVAADALIEKHKWRQKVKLVLQVHDELVYEVSKEDAEEIARTLRTVMEQAAPRERLSNVPIVAEASIGEHWGEMEKLSRD